MFVNTMDRQYHDDIRKGNIHEACHAIYGLDGARWIDTANIHEWLLRSGS